MVGGDIYFSTLTLGSLKKCTPFKTISITPCHTSSSFFNFTFLPSCILTSWAFTIISKDTVLLHSNCKFTSCLYKKVQTQWHANPSGTLEIFGSSSLSSEGSKLDSKKENNKTCPKYILNGISRPGHSTMTNTTFLSNSISPRTENHSKP